MLKKLESGDATFGVIGLGYVGLPLAVEVAESGFKVLGFDVSERTVDEINAGRSHVLDVESKRLAPLTSAGAISATTDMSRLSDADVISICVPTPLSKTKDPDVSYVVSAVDAVVKTIRKGQAIILESTTYPGTTRELLAARINDAGLRVGEDVFVAFSPERVDPGNQTWQTKNTPKVVGGYTDVCAEVAIAAYGKVFDTLVPVSSPEAAELVKLLENTFRSINIGLVNEMAIVCDKLGVNVWEVIDAAATKPFGFMKFTPGPGLGGHCIPIDPHYLAWKMRGLNYRTRFIDVASEVNSEMPAFWVRKVAELLNRSSKPVRNSSVLVLGVAYKKDISDVRESPALDVVRLLHDQGAKVRYHDPFVPEFSEHGVDLVGEDLTRDLLDEVDCIVLVTDHSAWDYGMLAEFSDKMVDTRNAIASRRGK